MTSGISEHYRGLAPEEVAVFAERVRNAWQDAAIPERQWNRVVADELQRFKEGKSVLPYDTLIRCLRSASLKKFDKRPNILDVGAASAYYHDVMTIAGYEHGYVAVDSSQAFADFVQRRDPTIVYEVADATALPFVGQIGFEIVLHSACIMHCFEWKKAISEAARVSNSYVIFHRTPISDKTRYFAKRAYDEEVLEISFNESELIDEFHKNGLLLINFMHMTPTMASYVTAKDA